MKLKVCGMKFPENIIEIENLKPDYMGFIFYSKSKRFFDQSELILDDNIKRVGVFVDQEIEYIKSKILKFKLDFVQLHGSEDVDFCTSLKSIIKIIKVFKINNDFNFKSTKMFESVSDYFLFDTKSNLHGGSGEKFDWNILKNYEGEKPFFLSGGIDLNDIKEIKEIQISHPIIGVDINSRFELQNLKKDRNKIKLFKNKLSL
jgi:phosphoribosylanthranilate isomerase